jgi:3-deoxy-7-phosphoheptulonate synthase
MRCVLAQIREGQRAIMGLLLESHLRAGRQRLDCAGRLAYGVSITDGCIGWSETESLLFEAAEAVEHMHGGGAS